MSGVDKKIIDTFRKAIPNLSKQEKIQLLCFGEGLAFKASQTTQAKERLDSEQDSA